MQSNPSLFLKLILKAAHKDENIIRVNHITKKYFKVLINFYLIITNDGKYWSYIYTFFFVTTEVN